MAYPGTNIISTFLECNNNDALNTTYWQNTCPVLTSHTLTETRHIQRPHNIFPDKLHKCDENAESKANKAHYAQKQLSLT